MTRLFAVLFALSVTSCGTARHAAPLVESAPPLSESAERGHIVYDRYCNPCHPNGSAGLGPALNDKPLVSPAVKLQIRQGVGAMPAFDDQVINDEELEDLVEYVDWLDEAEIEVSSR